MGFITCCPRYGLVWFYGSPGNESLPKLIYALYRVRSTVILTVLSGERTSLLLPIFIIQMKMEVLRLL